MRLLRMCEAGEIVTRFFTMVALGEVRRGLGDRPLPKKLTQVLRPSIERPTFGQWRRILEALVGELGRDGDLVVPEALGFVTQHVTRLMPGGDLSPEVCLIRLRNDLVHSGAMSWAEARRHLEGWAPQFEGLLGALAFLEGVLVGVISQGVARQLAGPRIELESGPATGLHLPAGVAALEGHVVLLRGNRWLDLWPLCEYGRASVTTVAGFLREAPADSPLVYMRAERDRLLYAALGVEMPRGERFEALSQFRALFRLEASVVAKTEPGADFEEEIRADSELLVGRVSELSQLKAAVRAGGGGVLWMAGPGGIGKSYLMARLATDLGTDPRRWCRIAWRFKGGDPVRCSPTAFFRHAVERLAEWFGRADVKPATNPRVLREQISGLLDEARQRDAAGPLTGGRRVLFVLDGLDEIERLDPEFPEAVFRLPHANVVWLCAGRPERTLVETFSAGRCTHVFEGGLPAMSPDDIRGMLLDGSGSLKYDLLRRDIERVEGEDGRTRVVNSAVDAVVARAQGLPLYVHFVVQDLLAREARFEDLERNLPSGLYAYYDNLLRRLAIGELQALLTPLVVTLAWALEPLEEETLHLLMVRRKVLVEGEAGRAALHRGLAALQSMLSTVTLPRGGVGLEPYHETFREHILEDRADLIGGQTPLAKDEFCSLALGWAELHASHPAREYALRFGPRHLVEANRWVDLEALLTDLRFLEAKCAVGLVDELVADFDLAAKRASRSSHILTLLGEAVQMDAQFLFTHPQHLFQTIWNRCWWYDSPEAAHHYVEPKRGWPEPPPWEAPGEKLYVLMDRWREAKERETGFTWLRGLRPPQYHLGTALMAVLRGHTESVNTVAFSPDGRRAASGSSDATIRVWNVETGRDLLVFEGHGSTVESVAFSPDGRSIVSGSCDGTVRLWDGEAGRELRVLKGHGDYVRDVAFDPGCYRVLSASCDKTLRLWDITTGKELWVARGHEGAVNSVSFSPDGRCVLSGSSDRTLRLWDADTAQELWVADGHRGEVTTTAFSSDGRRVISGSTDGTVRIWEVETGRELDALRGHERAVTTVTFCPEGCCILSGSDDKTLRRWDVKTGTEVRVLYGHEHPVLCLACGPGDHRVVSGSEDKTVRLWDLTKGRELRVSRGHLDIVNSVTFSPDGSHILSGSRDKSLRLWDTDTGREAQVLCRHKSPVSSVAFSSDGRRFVSGSSDRTVRVWDTETGRVLRTLRGHKDIVSAVAFSPDNKRILSGSWDDTARLWDAETGRKLRLLRGRGGSVTTVAFSLDGHRVATGAYDCAVRIWDLARQVREHSVLCGHKDIVNCVAFSPDGRRVVSGSVDDTVRLWDVESGEELSELLGHTEAVEGVAFSPDGRHVFSASSSVWEWEHTLRTWHAETGECLEVLEGQAAVPQPALASPATHPWLPLARVAETVVIRRPGQVEVGRLPLRLDRAQTSPTNPRLLMGVVDNYVAVFVLEGFAASTDAVHLQRGKVAAGTSGGDAPPRR